MLLKYADWGLPQRSRINSAMNIFHETAEALKHEMMRLKNRNLLEGIIAGCLLVAAADGSITSVEKQKMLGFVQQSEPLKVFDAYQVIEIFEKYVSKLEFDYDMGRAEALVAIGRLAKHPDEAKLLVRIAKAVAGADSDLRPAEIEMLRTIAGELDLEPQEFSI